MEKPGSIKAASKNCMFIAIFFGCTLGLSLGAQAAGENKPKTMDYSAVNQEISKFEAVINRIINNAFSSNPFAVRQNAKGAYLEGYGISFTFSINIHVAVISTPFGQFHSQDATPDLKKRRIEDLKEKLIEALQENGDILRQLRKDNYVAIVAFFEDRNIPDEPNINKTIVLSALKKDLDEFGHKSDRLQQFKQRMKIIEY
jgi:hypothetical protein